MKNVDISKELIVILKQNGSFELDWQSTEETNKEQLAIEEKLYNLYLGDSEKAVLYFGFFEQVTQLTPSLQFLLNASNAYIKKLSLDPNLEELREKVVIHAEENDYKELLANAPYMSGYELLTSDWIQDLWNRLGEEFAKEIKIFKGNVADFFAKYCQNIHLAGRVFFHLVESKKEEHPFAFLATYSEISKDGKSKHLPLKNALVEYGEDSRKLLDLLSKVYSASSKSSFVAELLDSGEIFHPLNLSQKEAYHFLKEIPLYEESGILCRIPNWWKKKSESVKMSINIGEKSPSRVNFNSLIDFNVQLSLEGDPISKAELKKLLSEVEGLALIKGKWIEVNHSKLKETLLAYEQARKMVSSGEMSLMDAMRFQLTPQKIFDGAEIPCELEIKNGEWLNSVIRSLTRPETIEKIELGKDFRATLRTYQERGLNWLHFMKTLGLGACLADDMGLGKTVQVIALLHYLRSKKKENALLVVPASLIGNWMDELNKFAPELTFYILHPSSNKDLDEKNQTHLEKFDLTITTYGMLQKYDWIKDVRWNTLILDEAQAIKNPNTKQTKTVKSLQASYRIAMTGTPIENRLSDLWSLFDFLNKGLLGTAKEFSTFTSNLKDNPSGYSKLKSVVSPFILRRLKTDKNIISDLPEKIEMKTYSTLTPKQTAIYSSLVNELQEKLKNTKDGIGRKGLVLASIMKFKQICNHPDQFLGQKSYLENESGKYARLREICETIADKRERVLVFTQFKEITKPLSEFLETVFSHKGLVLHGETPVTKRRGIVDKFQGNDYIPFLVLSIKAGGVGLNLTSANHVIHFDRWWNPAVENQATDRAFRIGQKKNVIVHKFITKGTIEEKIDLMIEDKVKLSKEIVPDIQESWITEMDNKELMNLFQLTN